MSGERESNERPSPLSSQIDQNSLCDIARDLWKPDRVLPSQSTDTIDDSKFIAQAGHNSQAESFGINKIDKGGTYEEFKPHASKTEVRADNRCRGNVVAHMIWQNDANGKLQYVDFQDGQFRLQKSTSDGPWHFYQRDSKGKYQLCQGPGYTDCTVSTSTGQVRLVDQKNKKELHIPINGPAVFRDLNKFGKENYRELKSLQACFTAR